VGNVGSFWVSVSAIVWGLLKKIRVYGKESLWGSK
jgi:hypothetical protein